MVIYKYGLVNLPLCHPYDKRYKLYLTMFNLIFIIIFSQVFTKYQVQNLKHIFELKEGLY